MQLVLCLSLLLFEAMTLIVIMNVTAYDFGIKKQLRIWYFDTFQVGIHKKVDDLYIYKLKKYIQK
jgi:hypothetical protein